MLPRITRRRFLAATGLTAVGLGAYVWRLEPHWLDVVERPLPIAGLPAALAGRTLVQISDLHVGTTAADYLRASLQAAASLAPAATVITGDFMTCRGVEQVDAVAKMLEDFEPGPLGCYAVLGNHDYARGWNRAETGARLVQRLTDLGIRVLQNECVTVAGLQLVGLDDLWGPRCAPGTAVAGVDWQGPVLTLCHNPDAVDLPELADWRGWLLAGHTHGGQCKLPYLPPPFLPVKNARYTAGAFDIGPGRWLYVNRGLGYVHRVRSSARPEITVFRMCAA